MKESSRRVIAEVAATALIVSGIGMSSNVENVNAETGAIIERDTTGSSNRSLDNTLAALGVRIENSNYSSEFPTRIAGKDRYDTAVEIAKQGWGSTGSKNVVLSYGGSNEECLAEAIASGPLANTLKAPILLTNGETLSSATIKEIKDLGATTIYITSRKSIIKQSVLDQLNGFTIKSVYGNDSPSTSVEIAKTIATISGKKFDTFALANGKVGTPDVLSISPIASAKEFPILLTDNTKNLPKVIKDYLATLSITKAYVVGGTAVVDDNQKSELVNPIRLAGMDRYDTNTAIIKDFCDDGSINLDHVFVANGVSLVDAISGVTMAANFNAAIVLTDGYIAEAADIVNPLISETGKVTALGGEAVVPSRILKTIGYNVEPEPIAVDAIDIEATKKAFKFMAGGEYADIYNSGLLIFTDPISKCTVVFDDKYYEGLDQQLSYLKDGSLTGEQLDQKYVENSGISKISGLNANNVVFRNNDGVYVFGENWLRNIDNEGNEKTISYKSTNPWAKPRIMWDKNQGICLSDGSRIICLYDKSNNGWKELENYVTLGSPEQRLNRDLEKLMYEDTSVDNTGKIKYTNPLGLSEDEVNKYLDTGNDEGLKSFQVAKDGDGKPAFIIVTGGEYGLTSDFISIVEEINRFDKKMIRQLVDQYYLRFITGDLVPGGYFDNYKSYASTPDGGLSGILINKDHSNTFNFEIFILLSEARGLYSNHHLEYANGEWIGVGDYIFAAGKKDGVERDKALWFKNLVDSYEKQNNLTEEEQNNFRSILNYNLKKWVN